MRKAHVTRRVLFVLLSLLFLTVRTIAFENSQQTSQEELTTANQELIKAKKENEDAQAAYYRELTKKFHEPSPTPNPIPRKTFRESIAENPASVIGIVGTILAALFAALVGLITLFVNRSSAIRALADTQFYEALKRFGDKDSATIRSSAAGLLGQMAQSSRYHLSARRQWPFLRIEHQHPYFTTALDQLLAGLLLEENPIALRSVGDAIMQMIARDPKKITEKLYDENLEIQREMASVLDKFFVINHCIARPDPAKSEDHDLWDQATSLSAYHESKLVDLLGYTEDFVFQRQTFKVWGQDDINSHLAIHEQLRITSHRLRTNVNLMCAALPQCPLVKGLRPPLYRSFLVDGSWPEDANLSFVDLPWTQLRGMRFPKLEMHDAIFTGANLRTAQLIGCNLRNADLVYANLEEALLQGANLEGANLKGANLNKTELGSVRIDDTTSFEDTEWWNSDFGITEGGRRWSRIDHSLLDKLFARYGDKVPPKLVNGQIESYLKDKRKNGPKAAR